VRKLRKTRICPSLNGLMRENAQLRKKCKIKGEELGEGKLRESDADLEEHEGRKSATAPVDYLSTLLGTVGQESVEDQDLNNGAVPFI